MEASETSQGAIELTRAQKQLLLYAETCLVDNRGRMEGRRMNQDDYQALKELEALGFLTSGRIHVEGMKTLTARRTQGSSFATHWVRFTDLGWEAAHKERRERSARMMVPRLLNPVAGEPEALYE